MANKAEVAGVVAGGVILFVAISLIPIIIMWQHNRRAAARRSRELEALREHGCMRQVSVERWLEEQRREPGNNSANPHDLGRYTQEPCSICLSTLLPSPSHPIPSDPEPPGSVGCVPDTLMRDQSLLILNRCSHAFHHSCLASWWEYRPYRCPICQASYAPEE